ncbi:hypothetical protein EV385_5565 [Krasilnikovia cinnamomea]|uniref:Uncharacterized protein n=1 Tax=Krasilnikovia cinnamomea TaxID=349313 RepID=A0A4Q7ZS13_9ACTN|nr:hypothetical protein [Krasilnikovia cinnamomea]RZU53634.1 hypothetical protein EV385_5565 [Krasilnikovia cinnamomea]
MNDTRTPQPSRRPRLIGLALASAAALTAGQLALSSPASASVGSDLRLVPGQSTTDSGFSKTAVATCPAGTVVYGGGGDIVGGGHAVILYELDSRGDRTHFFASAHEAVGGYTGSWTVYSWAVCGPNRPELGLAYTSAVNSTNTGARGVRTAVTCPAGKKVISVGGAAAGPFWYFQHQAPGMILDSLTPSSDLRSVTVDSYQEEQANNNDAGTVASAICGYAPAGLQLVPRAISASSTADKAVTKECPTGTRAISAAGGLDGAGGQAYLDRLVPHTRSLLTGGDIDARHDRNGSSRSWTASLYLICAQ